MVLVMISFKAGEVTYVVLACSVVVEGNRLILLFNFAFGILGVK
jgi:predicted GH43/DUF377 family glycosyl hydrolase